MLVRQLVQVNIGICAAVVDSGEELSYALLQSLTRSSVTLRLLTWKRLVPVARFFQNSGANRGSLRVWDLGFEKSLASSSKPLELFLTAAFAFSDHPEAANV